MRLVFSEEVDVYRHLAAEAYFLNEYDGDVLMLWQSKNAVVCGKHQNACGEANYKYCFENNIKIARRLSGGGTVFHDLGNINFTFVMKLTEGMERAVNYKRYLEPVRAVLRSLGIETTYSHRDDLLLNNIKISGNAQHIYQKGMKGLHHGTLLYDSDLKSLKEAIHSGGEYEGKSVPSNRSEVTNIRDWHDLGPTESFLKKLITAFETYYQSPVDTLNLKEMERCEAISQEKFRKEEWILGYSPRYTHRRQLQWEKGVFELEMHISQDAIESISIRDINGNIVFDNECKILQGRPLRLWVLQEVFEEIATHELLDLF